MRYELSVISGLIFLSQVFIYFSEPKLVCGTSVAKSIPHFNELIQVQINNNGTKISLVLSQVSYISITNQSIHLFIHLSVYSSINASIHLFTLPYIHLSSHPSIDHLSY